MADDGFDPEAFISGEDSQDAYKQALAQKIISGATDFTYGPGSPGATSSDMRQKTGSHDNPLQTGDVALPQKDYNLFTPEERQQLGIADTSWIKEGQPTPRGSVERYFGEDAQGFDPQRFIKGQDTSPIPQYKAPDVSAYLAPPPAEQPIEASTSPEPSLLEKLGSAIKAGAQAFGDVATHVPPLNTGVPQFHAAPTNQLPLPTAIPTPQPVQYPQQQLPGQLMQSMLGAQPSALPTPVGVAPESPITGGLAQAMVPSSIGQVLQSLRFPISTDVQGQNQADERWRQAVTGQLGPKEQVAAIASTAMAIDPLAKLSGKSVLAQASREIPGAFAGVDLPPSGRTISIPARPQPQLTEPMQFSVDMPTDQFATEQTPVTSALINDVGGVMSKSTAKRAGKYAGNEAQWEHQTPLAHPTHNVIHPSKTVPVFDKAGNPNGFRTIGAGGEMPDVAAQGLYDMGLLPEPSSEAMWNAVARESQSARSMLKSQRADATAVAKGAKGMASQTKAFNAAEQKAWKGGEPPIPVKDLQVGDKVTVGGQDLKVTDIDPDTHDVTLEDGTKYGVQSVKDGTVIYGQHEGVGAKPAAQAPAATPPPVKPPATTPPSPPKQPPPRVPPKQPAAPKPSYSSSLNPVADWGPFTKTYKIDKELGEMMDSLGAAPETGALMAETQARNMLHELTPLQEADLGKLLLSDRLKLVNKEHPDVIYDSVARGIEADPASAKALEYYRKEIEPELEEIGKRAGLQEGAAATQRGKYFTLVPERLPDGTVPELAPRLGQTSRTTKYSLPAEGMAAKYSSDIRNVLRQSYTERIRKAAARQLFDAAEAKGVVEKTPQFVPDPENDPNAGKWTQVVKENSLPEGMKHDLNLIAAGKSSMQPEGVQKWLQKYQRGATAVQLGMNPLEIQNHLRRQLHILATKPPIGKGVLARLEAVVPYFGPKLGALKRAMSDMSTPARQQILKDITQSGGGSSRAFREAYGTKLPVLKQVSDFTNRLLFGYPSGKGVMGFDLRMRVLLEEIRRNAEPSLANDKQRMRQFSNQMGQYGTMASWPVRALRHINPYSATTLPMRWAELRTLVGGSGLRSASIPEALMRRAETFIRGTGGTIAALTIANKLLSGNWPWQNRAGKEFDLKTGVKDKDGNDIYVPNRFLSPELFRAISTYSVPPLLAERGAPNRGALSETAAATLGPINAGLSLINSPALGIAAAAGPQWALHAEKWPGQKSIDIMKVGQYTPKDQARGVPPLLKRAEGVGEQLHPALGALLGYMEEPIKGLKPFGVISVDKSHTGSGVGARSSQGRRGSGRGRGRR